jgi:predicted ester cyclase
MSVKESEALMHRFWEELTKGNLGVWNDLCTPDYVYHGPAYDANLEQSKEHAAGLLAAFPDLKGVIDDMIVKGDYLVARYHYQGTHRGAYGGIAPTGKRVTVKGIEINRIAGGKFAETWGISDTFGLMRQLGAIPDK